MDSTRHRARFGHIVLDADGSRSRDSLCSIPHAPRSLLAPAHQRSRRLPDVPRRRASGQSGGGRPGGREQAHARQIANQIDALGRRDSALAERYDGAVLAQTAGDGAGSDGLAVTRRSHRARSRRRRPAARSRRPLLRRRPPRPRRSRAGSQTRACSTPLRPGLAGRSTDALDGARAARIDLVHQRAQLGCGGPAVGHGSQGCGRRPGSYRRRPARSRGGASGGACRGSRRRCATSRSAPSSPVAWCSS